MAALRRHLRRLNAARAVAASTLLVAVFIVELWFLPERSLQGLNAIAAATFATILLWALLEGRITSARHLAALQVAGDVLLVTGFVAVTGGPMSPLSFLYAVPVMVGAALLGLRGGLATAGAAWGLFALLLAGLAWGGEPGEVSGGRLVYAALSHLVGFLTLGALGGLLADRLETADRELEARRGDLAALRAVHADIVESITTGLMTTDRSGRITYVNRAGLGILRAEADEVVGRQATALFHLKDDLLVQARDHLVSGRRFRFERTWRRPADGEELFLGFALSELGGRGGEPAGWLLVFQDLTEIASLEEQVRTRERMAALGEMAAGIAHELRNPLAAITGCIQVLRQRGTGADDLMDVVVRESQRLDRTIRDFLQFARPGSFRPRPCDLAALMEELCRMLRKSPEVAPNHAIRVESGPRTTIARADPDRMRQVFWNLASNALKAMPEGGTLTIHVAGFGGDQVLVAFRDDGCGMDAETLRRFFQPFQGAFRRGSGLGAAIVYRIVEEHGGSVQVVSRRGRGTEIRLLLPAADEAERAASPVASGTGGEEAVAPVPAGTPPEGAAR